jgi:zinc protease
MRQPGPFQIGLQTRREQASEALKLVELTLRKFLADGPDEQEVRAAKRNLVDGFALRLDSNRKILEYLAVIGFYGLPLTWLDDFPRKLESVSAAEIRATFQRRVTPEHMVTVIVGGD